jgi:hypothetical protein
MSSLTPRIRTAKSALSALSVLSSIAIEYGTESLQFSEVDCTSLAESLTRSPTVFAENDNFEKLLFFGVTYLSCL